IKPYGEKAVEFYVFSATRPQFKINEIKMNGPADPCIQIETSKPLPAEECGRLSELPGMGLEHAHVLSAYRVTIRLRERIAGPGGLENPSHQLDIGPLQ